jgi:hypothetical protein
MLNCTDRDGVRAKCLIAAIATGNDAFVVAAINSARVGKTCDAWLGRRSKSPSIPWIGSTRGVEKTAHHRPGHAGSAGDERHSSTEAGLIAQPSATHPRASAHRP